MLRSKIGGILSVFVLAVRVASCKEEDKELDEEECEMRSGGEDERGLRVGSGRSEKECGGGAGGEVDCVEGDKVL